MCICLLLVVYCCVCVCSDGKVVSGGGDNLLKIWDLETGHVINTLSGHKQEVVKIKQLRHPLPGGGCHV